MHGQKEERNIRLKSSIIAEAKKRKLRAIKGLLREDVPWKANEDHIDCLSDDLIRQYGIDESENVSSHGYDEEITNLIETRREGLILDIGAGRRPVYYDNVVNFEIELFDTTDVRGVGERLPFISESFDCIISVAVLEHVKDPFSCAREIARTLKRGGTLLCSTAFLQPLHGYPNHYYNMTDQGLANLFDDLLVVDDISVIESLLPVWSLTWILQKWAEGLEGAAREEFLNLRVSELLGAVEPYLDRPFVKELPPQKNVELASGFLIRAHKP